MSSPLGPWSQMSTDTTSCYWCSLPAQGTTPDDTGVMRYTCGDPDCLARARGSKRRRRND